MNTRAVGGGRKVEFTILIFVLAQIVVEHQVLDALLLLLLSLLLMLQSHREVRVRWQFHSPSLFNLSALKGGGGHSDVSVDVPAGDFPSL